MNINPAIVIVAYNRPYALERILKSLSNANYERYENIPLIISIDGGADCNVSVVNVANNYQWNFGEKKVIAHKENMGLRKHVISCGALTGQYDNVLILEEDCVVSRNYYDFACKSLDFYNEDSRIAGISLYAYTCFESIGVPFIPLNDGYDVYFVQQPSSLGQVWTKKQWQNFVNYYDKNPIITKEDKMPDKVKTWPESSWKKYFYKYMIDKDLYFVYPQTSFTTNFGDVGTHFSKSTQLYQVPLENAFQRKEYALIAFQSSNNKYDAFFELLPECIQNLGGNIDKDTCIDLMGAKSLSMFDNKYALSIKDCNNKLYSYSNALQPSIFNILMNQEGSFFSYALKSDFGNTKIDKYFELISSLQPLTFNAGQLSIITGKCYKIGYYLLHPYQIFGMIKRKIIKKS